MIDVTMEQNRTLNILHNTFLIFADIGIKTEYIYKRGVPTSVKATFETQDRVFEYQIAKNGAIMKCCERSKFGVWISDLNK